MKIFYIDTAGTNAEVLGAFSGRHGKAQHYLGRHLVKTAAERFYGIENPQIGLVGRKPVFTNHSLQFSISHSRNIVLAAFDENPVGADVEFMKERDFTRLSARYNLKNPSREAFYRFWTEYEAGIKLGMPAKTTVTRPFLDDFMLTVAGDFEPKYEIYDLTGL